MILNFIDKIGDLNPQLMREIKGRLKVFPVVIAFVSSLFGQFILCLYQLREIPGDRYPISGTYCHEGIVYRQQLNQLYPQINQLQQQISLFSKAKNAVKVQELTQQLEQLKAEESRTQSFLYSSNQFCPSDQIDMQLWWRDHWEYIFLSLSVIFVFTLLVAGTYLLINNLAQEEHRGTLNFLRLSPQSETSILTGKILGVPILIYLAVGVAIPLHIWAGRSANIAFSHIFSFYIVLAASCIFFYSTALLFGFFSRFFSGFQPWLGSGAVLVFLIITMQIATSRPYLNNAAAWLRLLSPFDLTGYLFPNLFRRYQWELLEQVQFFYLPVGKNLVGLLGLQLLNYSLWTYWIWQGLRRRFRNPNASMLSKGQSYLLVACLQVILWGFTLQYVKNYCPPGSSYTPSLSFCYYDVSYQIGQNFPLLVFFNVVVLLSLISVVSPHRQAVQDWARYRHQNISQHKFFWQDVLLQDLIWSEKSPAVITMAINLMMITIPLIILIIIAPILNSHHSNRLNWLNEIGQFKAILGVGLFITLMMIYATVAQRMLLMKNSKRSFWAIATVGAVIFLPMIFLGMLGVQPSETPILWLLSTFPWSALEYSTIPTIFIVLLGEFSLLVLLNFQLTRQVRLAGESATKALLTGS
ncbi:ABC transporter permease [Chlorogloeopsis sp. ULAP01]|uniref:ABC transporter permease subunit n=1 Tax=Chlorogloeopsis sp. ULAP01 TaxID=3056483 RepID=UPI0025AACFE5|nr:ABC transporter permease subunit [Chlorogloeopsis sp. ULAP01]MDM9380408.1 ABC transporter permease [Chlorogloeopsis sp. ULAP01]